MGPRADERFQSDLTIKLDRGEGVMRNVSASGVYFVTDVDLKPGESFKFLLEFSGDQIGRVSARCEARVVRVEQVGSLKGVGAAFESIEFRRTTGSSSP
jgi:PilZ domain-containing protein